MAAFDLRNAPGNWWTNSANFKNKKLVYSKNIAIYRKIDEFQSCGSAHPTEVNALVQYTNGNWGAYVKEKTGSIKESDNYEIATLSKIRVWSGEKSEGWMYAFVLKNSRLILISYTLGGVAASAGAVCASSVSNAHFNLALAPSNFWGNSLTFKNRYIDSQEIAVYKLKTSNKVACTPTGGYIAISKNGTKFNEYIFEENKSFKKSEKIKILQLLAVRLYFNANETGTAFVFKLSNGKIAVIAEQLGNSHSKNYIDECSSSSSGSGSGGSGSGGGNNSSGSGSNSNGSGSNGNGGNSNGSGSGGDDSGNGQGGDDSNGSDGNSNESGNGSGGNSNESDSGKKTAVAAAVAAGVVAALYFGKDYLMP